MAVRNTDYPDIVNALVPVLAQVPGISVVLPYEPTALHDLPAVYLLLDTIQRQRQNFVINKTYVIMTRLCLPWQDNEMAEHELIPLVDAVADAIDLSPQLGGALTSGTAVCTSGLAGFVSIGGTLYRSLDYSVTVTCKSVLPHER